MQNHLEPPSISSPQSTTSFLTHNPPHVARHRTPRLAKELLSRRLQNRRLHHRRSIQLLHEREEGYCHLAHKSTCKSPRAQTKLQRSGLRDLGRRDPQGRERRDVSLTKGVVFWGRSQTEYEHGWTGIVKRSRRCWRYLRKIIRMILRRIV